MEKILLAVGNREMEEYLKKTLVNEAQFVGETVYREGVMRAIGQTGPSLVILKDALKGTIDMIKLIYDIRSNYPDVRILFIGVEREGKDDFYGNLVNYGVYDLVVGGRVNISEIISKIRVPSKHNDVKHYQPAPVGETINNVPSEHTIITLEDDEGKEDGGEESFDIVKKSEISSIKPSNEEPIKEKKQSLISKLKKPIPIPEVKKEKTLEDEAESNEEPKKVRRIVEADDEIDEDETDETEGRFGFLKRGGRNKASSQRILGINSSELSKDRIVTFMGGKSGIGTTSVAVNTAFELAQRGNEVLYLEVNQLHPSATYWFDLGMDEFGIDTALMALELKQYPEVLKAIAKSAEIKKKNGAMKSNYKKFPDGLDFMSYSGEYLLGLVQRNELPDLKELYLYLMYQGGYDYVIVDLSFFASKRDIQSAIMYSNKVFTVVNQDISTLGYHIANLNVLEQEGVSISKKNHYVVNSFSKSKFGLKDIKEWLEVKDVVVIPNCSVELSESNAKGLPTVINSKRSDFSASIREIIKIIGGK